MDGDTLGKDRNGMVTAMGDFSSMASALEVGAQRVAAWADILDRINIFPVADGDTGRNLVLTLRPLKQSGADPEALSRALLFAARGNAGNIAARFLSGLLGYPHSGSLLSSCETGRDLAYQAVHIPQPGTMLSLLDALTSSLKKYPPEPTGDWPGPVVKELQDAVRNTPNQLPALMEAGVVDSGALGMYMFLDAFFHTLVGREAKVGMMIENLKGRLHVSRRWKKRAGEGFCVDMMIEAGKSGSLEAGAFSGLGDSMVAISDGELVKVHLHVRSREELQERARSIGNVVAWGADDLDEQTRRFHPLGADPAVHLMTDAAGSLTREDAMELNITLLDSYVNIGDQSIPETYVEPGFLYQAMRRGVKVSTSQASIFERHENYRKALGMHERVLYLCVGSFYTTNYQVAGDWKEREGLEGRMIIADSGTASGSLGLAAILTARFALRTDDFDSVVSFARESAKACREFIFLDKLAFLAAGGRMSKTGAFLGDMLHTKPVVSPTREGAKKIATVRSRDDQVRFAVSALEKALSGSKNPVLMLQYTDNRSWIRSQVAPLLERRFPEAEILLRPISLTASAHMGPGTWAVAFLGRLPRPDTHARK